jgi:hypothetical protein
VFFSTSLSFSSIGWPYCFRMDLVCSPSSKSSLERSPLPKDTTQAIGSVPERCRSALPLPCHASSWLIVFMYGKTRRVFLSCQACALVLLDVFFSRVLPMKTMPGIAFSHAMPLILGALRPQTPADQSDPKPSTPKTFFKNFSLVRVSLPVVALGGL